MPQYLPVFGLSSLDGNNGFRIDGEAEFDASGTSVASAGDINHDGFADLIVGAPGASPNGDSSGASYVVFGGASGFGATLELSTLDGTNGFQLNGDSTGDHSGISVASAGDVDGDGFADLIVGADFADPHGTYSGASYVVFGKASGFGAMLELGTLNGNKGFEIKGEAALDRSGRSVASAGDVNGDGFGDLIVGAYGSDPHGGKSGASYVVFGKAHFGAALNLSSLDGTNGFQISGEAAYDQSGFSVASAGDVNGDGFADLIVGAYGADLHGNNSGASYVVFGKASGFAATLNLSTLHGNIGFQINGEATYDRSGFSVASAGDVNGDGFADLIVGAPHIEPHSGYSGASYVVFGKASGFGKNLSLASLDGTNGFQINGEAANDRSGYSVASAGDFNGDGFADLIVGAEYAGSYGSYAGASYVVFGKASGFEATLDLSSLDGDNGFKINGVDAEDVSGFSVASAGDVNGDGLDDLIVGAPHADSNGFHSGTSYVIYGALPTGPVVRTGTAIGNTIHGGNSDDTLSGLGGRDFLFGHGGNDTIDGGNGIDTVYGGDGNDRILAGADLIAGAVVDGGAGSDTVVLDGPYNGFVLTGNQLHDVEYIELTAGHGYKLSVNDSLLASGVLLVVNGTHLGTHDPLVFNGKGEHHGQFSVTGGAGDDQLTLGNGGGFLQSSLGHDTLTAGQGFDEFVFSVETSTGKGFETVTGFDFAGTPGVTSDQFSVNVLVTGIDSRIATGALTKVHFNADLALAADDDHLAASHAVIFKPDEGAYHGKTFLVIDQNGVAGYQSGGDMVVQLTASVGLASIDTGDFFTFF